MSDPSPHRIYCDLDDVLAQTIGSLIDLLDRLHGRRVAVETVTEFDLAAPFGLDEEELERLMDHAHEDAVLAGLSPVQGASVALGAWVEQGHHVAIVTGRPPATRHATSAWLGTHAISHHEVLFVDKYGRHDWEGSGIDPLRLGDLEALGFGFAVEDSLATAVFLAGELGVPVALVDQPWNREAAGKGAPLPHGVARCRSWDDVARHFISATGAIRATGDIRSAGG